MILRIPDCCDFQKVKSLQTIKIVDAITLQDKMKKSAEIENIEILGRNYFITSAWLNIN